MVVHVRFFAQLRERAGARSLDLTLTEPATVADALAALRDVVGELPLVTAVNRSYVKPDAPLSAGDELALIPPVSGGGPPAGAPHVRVTAEPLDEGALRAMVTDARAGAVVVFSGLTRETAVLEYEAYPEMAEGRISEIAIAAQERHGLVAVAVEHRIGSVPLSHPSVIVAVSGAHREETFAGAREIIDQLKASAPIWKKEEGEWVKGSLPEG